MEPAEQALGIKEQNPSSWLGEQTDQKLAEESPKGLLMSDILLLHVLMLFCILSASLPIAQDRNKVQH